jgi:hypothetical protein
VLNLRVDFAQRFLYGRDKIFDSFLFRVEIAARFGLETLETGAGELEERLVVAAEGISGEGLKGLAEFISRTGEGV